MRDYGDVSALQKREIQWRPVGEQKRVYLSVLSQIVKAVPAGFAAHAPSLRGSRRVYFARSRSEVSHTGKSNEPAKIPETDWWVSVNNAGERKQRTLADLMSRLGFSADYIDLVSWAPCYKFPELRGIRFSE